MSKYLTILPSLYHVVLPPGLLPSVNREAISYFGQDAQKLKLVEELGEFQQVLSKELRGLENQDSALESLANCYIMMDQYMRIQNISAYDLSCKVREQLVKMQSKIEG